MDNNKLRRLPLVTEINIFLFNLTFATLHVLLKPTGLEPAISSFCVGNLFGLILPLAGVVCAILHFIARPFLDLVLYSGAYADIFLENKFSWLGLMLGLNFLVALTDKSHVDVEGANTREPDNLLKHTAAAFWDSCFDYIQMTVVPWDEDESKETAPGGSNGNNAPAISNAKLPPNRQYIFAVHPHGIHCIPLALFQKTGTPFDKRFPGICGNKISGLVATVVFKIPGVREFFLSQNYIDASRHVAESALKANRSLFICTGSGEESLLTRQGEDTLVLSKRKGFIRLALTYGCDIVPIFGVGNSDLFKTYSWGMGVRMWLQKRLHISIPIFHGRCFTPLPYKVPLRVLVGEPLRVPAPKVKGEKPDEALVEEYLKKYIEGVKNLHKQHTDNRTLRII